MRRAVTAKQRKPGSFPGRRQTRARQGPFSARAAQSRGGRSTRHRVSRNDRFARGASSALSPATGLKSVIVTGKAGSAFPENGAKMRCAGPMVARTGPSLPGHVAAARTRMNATSGTSRAGGGAIALAPRSSQSPAGIADAGRAKAHNARAKPRKSTARRTRRNIADITVDRLRAVLQATEWLFVGRCIDGADRPFHRAVGGPGGRFGSPQTSTGG